MRPNYIVALYRSIVSPSLRVSISSGVAPLGVVVDGVQTAGVGNTFHDYTYFFNFGDTDTNTFTYGSQPGTSKNKHVGGPVSCYVYETPGTYTISMWVYDGTRVWGPVTNSVIVTSADTAYAGGNTICVSASGNFTGAPAGATLVTSSDLSGILTTYLGQSQGTNKRVLFRSGETFTAGVTSNLFNNSGAFVGAFGSGVRPVFAAGAAGVSLFSLFGTTVANMAKSTRLVGIRLTGAGFANTRGFNLSAISSASGSVLDPSGSTGFNLVHDCVVEDHDQNVLGGVGCVVSKTVVHRPLQVGVNISLFCTDTYKFGLLDCLIDSAARPGTTVSHNLRLQGGALRSVRGYSSRRPDPSRHDLTIRGDPRYVSGYDVVSGMFIDDSTGYNKSIWTVTVEPQNTVSNEVVDNVIIENTMISQASFGAHATFRVESNNVQIRNTVILKGDLASGNNTVVEFDNSSSVIPGNSQGLRVRNTSVKYTGVRGFTGVFLGARSQGSEISGLICYAPTAANSSGDQARGQAEVYYDGSAGGLSAAGNTALPNLKILDPLWVNPGSTLDGYTLQPTSPYISAGAPSAVHQDALGKVRNVSGVSDTGAINSAVKAADIWSLVP